MFITVDHVTYGVKPLPQEREPVTRLWTIIKQGPVDDASYWTALQESYYGYYMSKGCTYKGRT